MSNGIERGASFLDSAAETLRNGALVTFPPVAAATLSTRKASPPKPEYASTVDGSARQCGGGRAGRYRAGSDRGASAAGGAVKKWVIPCNGQTRP